MKKSFLSFLFMLLCLNVIIAQEGNIEKQKKVLFIFGVSWVPSNSWGVSSIIAQKQLLKYNFDATSMTAWEGSITGRQMPFRLGVNVQFEDNFIGKLCKFSGYLGFKRTYLRIQTGKISGIATWTGNVVPNYSSTFPFSYSYSNIDLLLSLSNAKMAGAFIGIGYTSLKVPIQVNTLITQSDQAHQEYGVPVFEKEFSIKAYSFLFGMDLMQSEAINKKGAISGKTGFGIFAATQDKFGLGMSYLTKETIRKAEEVNPGKESVGGDLFSALLEYQISLGPKWSTKVGNGIFIIGIGYEFSGAMVANFTGAAKESSDLGYDPSLFYYRHGIVFRSFLSW